MWKTVLALLVTIVVIPFVAFRFDDPLTVLQSTVLTRLAIIYIVAALLCFIVSTLSNNYSQVDKLWSTIPLVYVWVVVWESGFEARIVLMAFLVSAWGLRLSYNFSRRGGFSWRFWEGEEDYRWAVLRAKPEFAARWKWVLFNFLFISLYQMGLILLITLPAVRSMGGGPLTIVDAIIAVLLLGFIVIETVADQQQWNYHRQKQGLRQKQDLVKMRELKENGREMAEGKIPEGDMSEGKMPEKYAGGFVSKGLWGMVRHPNYAAEQAIWITFYFFSVAATGQWINWSVMGAILLILLFWGSSNFSESISSGKYPEYAAYIKRVPRFVPLLFGNRGQKQKSSGIGSRD